MLKLHNLSQSGKILLFPTPFGIKVMNLVENKVVRLIGKPEAGERFLGLTLMQVRFVVKDIVD
jgi:peptidylprolyl isomerase domain and WD repeat-containing protein 1